MKTVYVALIACLLSVMFLSTSVADSFRCGSHLIEEGMHRSKVLEYCGPPTEEKGWTWHYVRGTEGLKTLIHFDADGTVNRIEDQTDD